MTDTIKKIGSSLIQFGKENDRIYLMKLAHGDVPGVLEYMNNLAFSDDYSKIVAKVPESLHRVFLDDGYENEAFVNKFYRDGENCRFMCKFLSESRRDFSNVIDADIIRRFCSDKARMMSEKKTEERYCIKKLEKKHICQITQVFKVVFETYPFPVFDNSYIQKTMDENIEYFGVFDGEKLVAVSSSEMDFENQNSEMTDFAVLPEYRGNHFSYHLLNEMEKAALKKGLSTVYTIARSQSKGINISFLKAGYTFGGKLINNTNICGKIQTMNVWFKEL